MLGRFVGFRFWAFCGACSGKPCMACVAAAAAVIGALTIPQLRDRLLTAFTWAYVQESSQPGGRIYQWEGHWKMWAY